MRWVAGVEVSLRPIAISKAERPDEENEAVESLALHCASGGPPASWRRACQESQRRFRSRQGIPSPGVSGITQDCINVGERPCLCCRL